VKNLDKILAAILIAALSAPAIAEPGPDRKALFGELHMHTWWSLDAYAESTRATPDDAYEFAKGMPKKHPNGQTYRISRPLDFMAVTDHSEFMGIAARMADPEHSMSKLPIAERILSDDRDQSRAANCAPHRGPATPWKVSTLPR